MIVYYGFNAVMNTVFIMCLNTMSTGVIYRVVDTVYKHEWI